MKPFDNPQHAVIKLYRGDFAGLAGLGNDESCVSIMLAFQHEDKFDREDDCYFVCAHDRRVQNSIYFVSNAFGPLPPFDPPDNGRLVAKLSPDEYFAGASLRDLIEMARMVVCLRRQVAGSKKSAALRKSLGLRVNTRWTGWMDNAAHCCVRAVNELLNANRREGCDLVFGTDMDVRISRSEEKPSDLKCMVTDDGHVFYKNPGMAADGLGPGWNAELKCHTDSGYTLFLVRRNEHGEVCRVACIDPKFTLSDPVFDGWRGAGAADPPIVAAMFDDETRRKFHLLRQDVCEVSEALSGDDGEYLVVTNDDGEAVSVDRGKAVSIFTA